MPPPALPLLRFGIEAGIELFGDLVCSGDDQQEIKLEDLVEVRISFLGTSKAIGSTHPLHAQCSHVLTWLHSRTLDSTNRTRR